MTDLPAPLLPGLLLRRATATDVPALVALLADDPLGAAREDTGDLAPYRRAFTDVHADPAHLLVVVAEGPEVVAPCS